MVLLKDFFMIKNVANIFTTLRIFSSVLLLLFSAFSVAFYITYLFCGFSDMIDGPIARKTNNVSEFGAHFDTIADFVFLLVCSIKILPSMHISVWLWVWIVLIALIKMRNIALVFIYKKKLLSIHSVLNKTTGFALFLFPLALSFAEVKYSIIVVCSIATMAAIQEWVYIKTE